MDLNVTSQRADSPEDCPLTSSFCSHFSSVANVAWLQTLRYSTLYDSRPVLAGRFGLFCSLIRPRSSQCCRDQNGISRRPQHSLFPGPESIFGWKFILLICSPIHSLFYHPFIYYCSSFWSVSVNVLCFVLIIFVSEQTKACNSPRAISR